MVLVQSEGVNGGEGGLLPKDRRVRRLSTTTFVDTIWAYRYNGTMSYQTCKNTGNCGLSSV
jgi:hypothetical protein